MTFNFNINEINTTQNSTNIPEEDNKSVLTSIIPAMTSNNSKGFSLESDNPTVEGYDLWNMFAYRTGAVKAFTAFKPGNNTNITITCDKEHVIDGYMLSGSTNDTYGPKIWRFYGSNNKKDWTELDYWDERTMTSKTAVFRYLYNLPAYKYFRLHIIEQNMNASVAMHIKDFQLFKRTVN